jgi:hypothetical protein
MFGLALQQRMSGGEIIKPLLHPSRLGMGRGWVLSELLRRDPGARIAGLTVRLTPYPIAFLRKKH